MTLRTPLYDAVTPTEIGSSDFLDSDIGLTVGENQTGASVAPGVPVYASAAGEVDLAQASSKVLSNVLGLTMDTAANAADVPIQTCGVLVASVGEWEDVMGDASGLTAGTVYFLDPDNAGMLTDTAPTTTGDVVVRIGIGVSATEMRINIERPILL